MDAKRLNEKAFRLYHKASRLYKAGRLIQDGHTPDLTVALLRLEWGQILRTGEFRPPRTTSHRRVDMTEMTKEKGKILVYEPVAEASGASAALAARPESLNGKSVGLINNTKDFTDEILGVMGAELQKQFPGVRVVRYRKESVSGASQALMEQVERECDAVVCALGD
jgi:hypothetical protein